jgi:hypothetical protein
VSNIIDRYSNLESVCANIDDIRGHVDDVGFAILRGMVGLEEVETIKQRILNRFNPKGDIRISGDYKRGSQDFQRLDLGEYLSSSRFARYFFYFPWNNDHTFQNINNLQMKILNQLGRKSSAFGSMVDDNNPNRFRMSYVIQYPTGGGFMSKHREHTMQEEGDKAYVVYLALTSRSKDFHKGGAYVFQGDTKLDIEKDVLQGDLIIYRGDRYHGVDGVDRDKPVDLGLVCGRMILTTVVAYFKD